MKQIKEVNPFAHLEVSGDIKEITILEERANENTQSRCLCVKGFQPAVESLLKYYVGILGNGTLSTLKGNLDGQAQDSEGKIWIPIKYSKYSWGIERNTIFLKNTIYKIVQ